MTSTTEEIKTKPAALSAPEQAEMASFLLDSLQREDPDIGAAWRAELVRKAEAIKNGQAAGTPADKECAELRAQLAKVESERDIYLEAIHGMTRHLVRTDFTREELDEMERNGITGEQILAEIEKIVRG